MAGQYSSVNASHKPSVPATAMNEDGPYTGNSHMFDRMSVGTTTVGGGDGAQTQFYEDPERRTSLGEAASVNFAPFRNVKRDLQSYHIFFIVISGVVGMGLFANTGEILAIAGPAGALTAVALAGIGIICVMEGIAEMVGHWPISNSMMEFVGAFVDKDLSLVIGIAYWYAYSISFAALVITASDLTTHWDWSPLGQHVTFVALAPLALTIVNCLGVKWYGNVEAVLGCFKVLLIFGSFLLMCMINSGAGPLEKVGPKYINAGFRADLKYAANPAIAVLLCVPIVAYAFVGVEIVAVTALEARNPTKSLKFPARYIGYMMFLMYFVMTAVFALNVAWDSESLPTRDTDTYRSSVLIIATKQAGIKVLPSLLNAALIICLMSSANTALYVASRTLYGLTREIDATSPHWWMRALSKLSTTTSKSQVPGWALVVSALLFCWLPFLHLKGNYTNQDIQEVMSGMATIGVVIVWASQCLAFIRYRKWLGMHKTHLRRGYKQFDHISHNNKEIPFSSVLEYLQPIPAWIGLIGCIFLLLVLSNARWWNGKAQRSDYFAVISGPVVLSLIFVCLKLYNRRGWVHLGEWKALKVELDNLNSSIVADVTPQGTTRDMQQNEGHVLIKSPNPQPPIDTDDIQYNGDVFPRSQSVHLDILQRAPSPYSQKQPVIFEGVQPYEGYGRAVESQHRVSSDKQEVSPMNYNPTFNGLQSNELVVSPTSYHMSGGITPDEQEHSRNLSRVSSYQDPPGPHELR